MFKKWSCISALLACMITQSLSARNIFVTSGDPASSTVSLFSTEPLSFAGTITVADWRNAGSSWTRRQVLCHRPHSQ